MSADRDAARDAAPGDDDVLDALLARFVDDLASGREPDAAAAVAEHPSLRDRILETLRLARDVVPGSRSGSLTREIAGHEIVREIGTGGMGSVLLARDSNLGRLVALKVVRPDALTGRARERFLREARAVARLRHPSIVTVYDAGESADGPWFSMELLDGRTLAAEIADLRTRGTAAALGVAHVRRCAAIAFDLASALAHAHDHGVVHRDVKPANVMLRPDGRVVLFDFGLADVADEATLTREGAFLGTPQYASPEQAAGRADLDGRTDVWSLGAVLHEMLALTPPYAGATPREILRRVETEDPVPVASCNTAVPGDLAAVVARALSRDRARRWGSAREMADALSRFLRGEPQEPDGGAATATIRRSEAAAVLARTSREFATLFAATPLQLADVRSALARSYGDLGMFAEAREQAAEAFAIQERVRGTSDAATISALADFARITREAGDMEGGIRLAREAVRRAAALPEGHRARLRAMRSLGVTLVEAGAVSEAEPLLVSVWERTPRDAGADEVEALGALHNLAVLRANLGRAEEAERMFAEVVERRAALLGETNRETLEALQCLVFCTRRVRGAAAAYPLSARLLDLLRRPDCAGGYVLAMALSGHARILEHMGRLDEAESVQREAYDAQCRQSGPSGVDAALEAVHLARLLRRRGDAAGAVALARSAAGRLCAQLPPGRDARSFAHSVLFDALVDAGSVAEAEEMLRAEVARIGPEIASAGPPTRDLAETLARHLDGAGRAEEGARVRAALPPA